MENRVNEFLKNVKDLQDNLQKKFDKTLDKLESSFNITADIEPIAEKMWKEFEEKLTPEARSTLVWLILHKYIDKADKEEFNRFVNYIRAIIICKEKSDLNEELGSA